MRNDKIVGINSFAEIRLSLIQASYAKFLDKVLDKLFYKKG
jgi:hypothetical protein